MEGGHLLPGLLWEGCTASEATGERIEGHVYPATPGEGACGGAVVRGLGMVRLRDGEAQGWCAVVNGSFEMAGNVPSCESHVATEEDALPTTRTIMHCTW